MSGKYALIIGNTEYTDPGLAQLSAPGKDAEDFARVLRDRNIAAFDEVNILLNQSAATVNEAIDEFFDQKKPDDLLVLYFSGHGVRDELGALYLAVKNTIRSRLRSTAVKSDYIRDVMDQSRSKRQVLILDCCNSGAFAQGAKAATGVSIGTASAFESGYGRIILTASDSTQFAWEGDKIIGETDNSLFTHFLVEGLEGEADLDSDGHITVDELYDYAYEKVKIATPKQTPSKFSTKQQGEIVLRQITNIDDIKPISLPDQLLSEIENPYPEVRLRAVEQLVRILNGKNLGLVRSATEALEKIFALDDSRRVVQAAAQGLELFRQVEKKAAEERKAKEETERLALLKTQEESLAREKADAERKAKEEADRLARAHAEREASEREAIRLKAEREAAEKAAKERAEKEISDREATRLATEQEAAREKAEREAALKAEHNAAKLAARKKVEREAAEKAEREAVELAACRKAEREAAEKAAIKPVKTTNSTSQPFLKWAVIGVIGLCVLAAGIWGISYLDSLGGSDLIQTPVPATNELLPIEAAATADVPVVPNAEPIEITLWHAYDTGSAEQTALSILINNAAVDLPQYKINILQVPFNDIFNKYRTDVASGGGPHMFIVPNDSLGDDARAGLIADITTLAEGKVDGFNQLALDGMTLDGKLYGIPESFKAVAFWYNKELLPTPPATTDELKALMKEGKYVAASYGCYHHYGFFKAFGGDIFDENWKVVADQGTGVTDAVSYLNDLYQISNANGWAKTDSDGLAPFTEGYAVAIINGNWAMGDYYKALGDKLAVAPLPAGPAGPAGPMLGIDGFYFNPNSTNQGAAVEVALYLTNAKSQTVMMNEAGHVPVQSMIITDPIIQGLVRAFKTATIRPQVPELGKYWSNFCGTDQVFEAGTPAADWVKAGTEASNK